MAKTTITEDYRRGDDTPDVAYVTFALAAAARHATEDAVYTRTPIKKNVDDAGHLTVQLQPTSGGDADWNVEGLHYRVQEVFLDARGRPQIKQTYYIDVPTSPTAVKLGALATYAPPEIITSVGAELASHTASTTDVHGIADTSALATGADIAAHSDDTTGVHGIADTSALLTQAAANATYVRVDEAPLDPARYGAVGDGVADDTDAMQDALDAIPASGGQIYLRDLAYLVRPPLLVSSKSSLVGRGMGLTTIKAKAGSYTAQPKTSMLLNRQYAAYANNNVMVDSAIHVQDLTLDGNRANINAGVESEGIDWVGVEKFTITRVELLDITHDAIDLDACHYGVISGCRIDNAGWNGVHAGWIAGNANEYITVEDCVVTGCAQQRDIFNDGLNAGIHNDSVGGIVRGNTVLNCYQGILVSTSNGGGGLVDGNYIGVTLSDYGIAFGGGYGRLVNNYVVPGSGAIGPILLNGTGFIVCANNAVGHGTYGIRVQSTKPAVVAGNAVRGALIQYAIEVQSAAHVIDSNTIENYPSNAARGAIHFLSTAVGGVAKGNRIDAATGTGRGILSAATGVTIDGNTFNGTPAAYIEVAAADNIVTANNGRGAATAGLVLAAASSYALVDGNIFRGSAAGASVAGSGHVFGTNSPTIP